MKRTPIGFTDVPVPLKGTALRVAIVQLDGPEASKVATIRDGRQVYAWTATSDTEERVLKVLSILDWIHEHESAQVVVFPEYSFPVELALPEIRSRVASRGTIVVAGADTIDVGPGRQENNSIVVTPNGDRRIPKRTPSQWEAPFIDAGAPSNALRFTWDADGVTCWLMVYVCLDFLDHAIVDVHLNEVDGPGLFIVPMSSPRIEDFHVSATALMRRPGGTAAVLCHRNELLWLFRYMRGPIRGKGA